MVEMMASKSRTAAELLDHLRRLGVTATVRGERNDRLYLHPRAPLSGVLLAEIRNHKHEIIARLLDRQPFQPDQIRADDRRTWPAYLHRLERLSREQFGEEAAERQVQAEMAFLATAEPRGWTVLPDGLGETETPS
jgi:hypothetical protein